MKKIKTILFILILCIFIALLVIALLLPGTVYERISDKLFEKNSPATPESSTVYVQKKPLEDYPDQSLPKRPSSKQSPSKQSAPKPDGTVEIVKGFDWRLPTYVQPSELSGLISETRGSDDYIKGDFHMVRWDKTNPAKGVYDFQELKNNLRNRPNKQVLLRLETYGKCEAPSWALKQLQITARGTLIFWQDQYVDVLRPYISEVAQLVNQYPQIVGVQIGISDGQYRKDCSKFSQKDGWGEFNLKPEELRAAQDQLGLTPDLLERSAKRIIDLYADEFGGNSHKLVFNNFDMFSWTDIATPYNARMPAIAKYALDRGIGNRDGQIEHWMRYLGKIYGMGIKPSTNQTCSLEMNETLAKRYANRYWGTENEEFGDYYWVKGVYGGVKNQPHRFFASSLRALQMRRNYMTIIGEGMKKATDPVYKTQDFLRYLANTLGKQPIDTPDAFILLGERYVANYRMVEHPQHKQCQSQGSTAIRSFGRWISENSDSQPSMRIDFPTNDKRWGQGFYLPNNVNYEYAARASTEFSFNLNDELGKTRCANGCNVEVKVSYKDDNVSKVWIESLGKKSSAFKTSGDGLIKTATFKMRSSFNNRSQHDLILKSDSATLSVILLRINFLDP